MRFQFGDIIESHVFIEIICIEIPSKLEGNLHILGDITKSQISWHVIHT